MLPGSGSTLLRRIRSVDEPLRHGEIRVEAGKSKRFDESKIARSASLRLPVSTRSRARRLKKPRIRHGKMQFHPKHATTRNKRIIDACLPYCRKSRQCVRLKGRLPIVELDCNVCHIVSSLGSIHHRWEAREGVEKRENEKLSEGEVKADGR